MSYRLINSNELAEKYPEVNDMPCIWADLPNGIDNRHYTLERGHWTRKTRVENVYDIAGVKTWGIKCQCDRCTFTMTVIEGFGYYDYCPHCGADMRENK